MSEEKSGPSAIFARGGRESIIQTFSIEGLHGYRNIGLTSSYAATILIAKNGTGKTTLLGALDAFLRLQLGRLRELQFEVIRCSIAGFSTPLTLTHDEVIEFLQVPNDAEFRKTSARAGVDPQSLFNFIMGEYSSSREDSLLSDDKLVLNLKQSFSYNYSEIRSTLDKLAEMLYSRVENIAYIRSSLREALADIDIVYLPTYRRIELALREDEPSAYNRRRGPKFNVALGSLYTGEIQFGLGDITDRLRAINSQIVYSSNTGYGTLSANIINELIDGSFEREEITSDELPSKDELEIFFSRLREGRRSERMPSVVAPNLDKLFSNEEVPPSSAKFLRYFLKQLAGVIEVTKKLEAPVDDFINNCNKYLMSREPSTEIKPDVVNEVFDGKRLTLSRRNLRVQVESVPDERKISLNALSSGEKQMISLFAKLFLYPKKKIVLIDEPELSLSIDWQSQILVDVLKAPLCQQIIAITHSPFVFDNELDPFAQPLRISRYLPEDVEEEFSWDLIDERDELEDD